MSNYKNAQTGLRIMCIAAIGTFLCTVFAAIPFVGMFLRIGIFLFFIMDIVGYYFVGKDIKGCMSAFGVMFAYFVLQVIHVSFRVISERVISLFLFVALTIMIFLLVRGLRVKGEKELAKKGIIAWFIYLVSIILKFALELLKNWLVLKETVVALVFRLNFYKKSAVYFGKGN